MIAKNWIIMFASAILISGCGESKDTVAIDAVKEFIMKEDNGTSKLTNVEFFPDEKNINKITSGFVCGTVNSPTKDGGMMAVPFYSHVFIFGDTKKVTDMHLAFSWDEKAKIEHNNKCYK